MVNKYCVPGCNGNYSADDTSKVHVFKFPTNEEVKQKWLTALRRKNFVSSKHSVMCHRHFAKSDIEFTTAAVDWKTGKTITVSLEKPRVKSGAVPCIFPQYASYFSKQINYRESPFEKKTR